MTLMERLRDNPERFGCASEDCEDCALYDEAADHIEDMEAALREIVEWARKAPGTPCHIVAVIAMRALDTSSKEKDHDRPAA